MRVPADSFMMSAKKEWRCEEIKELISLYETYPVLWDVSSKDYKNREVKDDVLKEFGEKFKCTPQEIVRKLHNLRNQVSC